MNIRLTNFVKMLMTIVLIVVLSSNLFAQSKNVKNVADHTSIAVVSGTADGKTISYTNPYNNQSASNFAGTFNGTLNSQAQKFYCIDLQHGLVYNQDYWDEGSTSSQITYILNNFFPYKTSYSGKLSDNNKEAAAVQMAIWYFSDGVNANTISNDSDVKARTLAIIAASNSNHNNVVPLQTLIIVPASQSFIQGTPATFNVFALDLNGNPIANAAIQLSTTLGSLSATNITTNSNGQAGPVTLTYAGLGTATIKAKTNVQIPQGTRYVHKSNPDGKQKLVLATPSFDLKEVTATVNWYAPPANCDLNGYVTFTQGGWGSPSNSGPGIIRDTYFNSVFPSGLVIGSTYKLTLTTATTVKNFLPQGGTAAAFTANNTNVTSTSAGILGGQLVALKMNVVYGAAGKLGSNSTPLGSLVIVNGPFMGYSVTQFLTLAEQAIGGGSLNGFTFSQINDAATAINENFDNGTVDKGFLTCSSTKASIGDRVWEDTNINGIQDNGENGIANVTVKLYDCNNNLKGTTTTDSNGNYLFSNLTPGDYYVLFVAPATYVITIKDAGSDDAKDSDVDASTGKTICTTLSPGENDLTWDAGMYKEDCKNKIGDYVWHDKNVDGKQDSSEPGIAGVVVELLFNNSVIAKDTTDANGKYEFVNLSNGTYAVRVASSNYTGSGVLASNTQTKWYSTKKNQGSDDSKDSDANKNESVSVTLNCNNDYTIDFGFYKTCVSVIKTANKQTALPGDIITYTFTVENCGDITLSGGVDFYDAMINPSGDNHIKNITPVNPGEIKSFTKTYTVKTTDCGSLVNTVKAVGHPIDGSQNVEHTSSATVEIDCGTPCVTDWTVTLGPDSAICEYDQKNITINGSVHLTPNPSNAILQLSWRIVEPNDGSYDNSTHYQNIPISKDTTFSITALWPGIRPSDSVVEIHYGVNILDCDGNPIKNGVGRDLYWYPWVCPPPPEKPADVKIEKFSSTADPKCGDQFTYTVKVTNNGPNTAKGIQATDLLPTGLIYNTHSASQGTYNQNTGLWNIGDLNNGAFATLSITVIADCNQINGSTFDLGPAKDYNLFVILDATQPSSDTQGRVAVGRNAQFGNYSVGDQLPSNSGDVLIVGNNLTYTSGAIYNGNVVYGNTTNLPIPGVSITGGTLRQDNPINFAAAKTYLENLSTTLSGYVVNGTTASQWGGITLTGTDPFLNVFSVAGSDLSSSNNLSINVPNGSVVLVNINGTNVSWSGGLTVSGTSINNVLYNFHQATTLTIQGIDIRGSVLAPKAALNFASGVINGQMICKSLTGMGQFNHSPFGGNIPIEKKITNIATITSSVSPDPNPNNNSASVMVTITNSTSTGNNNNNNNGTNWQQVNGFGVGEIVYSMIYSGNAMYAGTWGGKIYKSTDNGLTWTVINSGMNVSFIWSLQASGGFIFAATEQGVFKYNGSTWSLTTLAGIDVHSLAYGGGALYAGTWGIGVFKSTDNGTTWIPLTATFNGFMAIQSLVVTSNGDLFVGTVGGGIFKSSNGGSSFVKTTIGYDFIWALGATSNGTIFAGSYGDGLYRSADGGATFAKITSLNVPFVYSIVVDASNKVYVASWTSGVFVSNDNGNTWSSLGMGGLGVSALIVSNNSNNVFIGTKEGKIFMSTIGTTTDVAENLEMPTRFELNQNYPNPFNPSTTIQFAIPDAGKYSLRIYNVLGQEVATLLDGELNAGLHKASFDAGNIASGMYIYKLVGNNVNISKKMILMK